MFRAPLVSVADNEMSPLATTARCCPSRRGARCLNRKAWRPVRTLMCSIHFLPVKTEGVNTPTCPPIDLIYTLEVCIRSQTATIIQLPLMNSKATCIRVQQVQPLHAHIPPNMVMQSTRWTSVHRSEPAEQWFVTLNHVNYREDEHSSPGDSASLLCLQLIPSTDCFQNDLNNW